MAISTPEILSDRHEIDDFDCGEEALNVWLRRRARSNVEQHFSVVVVVHENLRVVGYYALTPTAVAPELVPRSIRTGQPPDPLPCILLGQLAVDKGYAGRGIAEGLLKHAYGRYLDAAHLIAGRALIVHAIHDRAAAYWRRRGFVPSKKIPHLLMRSFADIERSQRESAS